MVTTGVEALAARVLYIEDNPHNVRLVRKMLGEADIELLAATTGTGGLAAAAAEQPDLILLDINLPDIDGYEVATRLKATPSLSWIPIVALTANAMHGDRERILASGCDAYIAKPILRTELLNVVSYFLGSR